MRVFSWLRTLLWLGARCICPKCEKGRMFRSYYTIHEKCPECGVTFQPYEGDILGVIAVGYFLTVIPTFSFFSFAYLKLGWTIETIFYLYFLSTAALLFAFYPSMKGIWVAFVYLLTGLRKRL